MMVFIPLVLVWIGQFCRDAIGRQNVKVVVIGRLVCCYFSFFLCLLALVLFIVLMFMLVIALMLML